jgi:4'-phosphopantetheinyl transferase
LSLDLEADEVHVWWGRRRHVSRSLESLLDDVERGRLARYTREEDRERFLAGCALAKLALGLYLDVPAAEIRFSRRCNTCGRPHGKPRVVTPPGTSIELSVSHSGELVAVAVAARNPVGVDVERLDRALPVDELEGLVLATTERVALASLSADERRPGFLVWWTRKEACVKATALGLRLPLPSVVVTRPDERPRLLAWPHDIPPEEVMLFDLGEHDGHLAALAVLGSCAGVHELDGDELLH